MKRSFSMYLKLFLSTLYLSAFTFGGGYVIVPLMRKRFVNALGWINEREMLDLIAIAQSAPGPIAVNTSVIIGYRVGGILGAVVSLLGTTLPPLVIMCGVTYLYQLVIENAIVAAVMKGMSVGVAAVIVSVVIQMATSLVSEKYVYSIAIFTGALFLSFFLGTSTIVILLAAAACGLVIMLADDKKERDKWRF